MPKYVFVYATDSKPLSEIDLSDLAVLESRDKFAIVRLNLKARKKKLQEKFPVVELDKDYGIVVRGLKNVYRADFRDMDFTGFHFPGGHFVDCDFTGTKLQDCNLNSAHFTGCHLERTDFHLARMEDCKIIRATAVNSVFSDVYLANSELRNVNFANSDFSFACLFEATIERCNFSNSDMFEVRLEGAKLVGVNLSGASNWFDPIKFMKDNFETCSDGFIVYKAINNKTYDSPRHWKIASGEYLEEVVNPSIFDACGCGVSFGTFEWVKNAYPTSSIWRCIIEWQDLLGVVVPFHTDGKARCSRLRLLEEVRGG